MRIGGGFDDVDLGRARSQMIKIQKHFNKGKKTPS